MSGLRICLAAAEASPLAKTGGLADVSAALARELHAQGHDARLFLPLHRRIRAGAAEERWTLDPDPELRALPIWLDGREFHYHLVRARLPGVKAPFFLVDCPELFDRPAIYTEDEDEPLRFALLCQAVLHTCQRWQWAPQVVHANDWHTALLPLLLRSHYAWDRLFADTQTVLTIHNIGYQGWFEGSYVARLGLEDQRGMLDQDDLTAGHLNLLKTGLLHADTLTTVSRSYAEEIQTAEFGHGLEGVLRARAESLHGIVNGVDYSDWSPEADALLPATYSAEDLSGKEACRKALLERLGLAPAGEGPVLGVVSRLAWQKGFEILQDVLPVLLQREDVRLCVLGTGEEKYERYFHWLAEAFPGKAGFHCGFSNELAHLVEAGSDVFLMPSRYEPCGLNQMYSLRYGTVPVVRRTGGLADTVEEWNPADASGTGFLFGPFESEALYEALRRALTAFTDREAWTLLMLNGMARDFSWQRQAGEYLRLYRSMVGEPG